MALFSGGGDAGDDCAASSGADEVHEGRLDALMAVARSSLCLSYVEATALYLKERSGLLDLLVARRFEGVDSDSGQLQGWLAQVFEHNGLWIRLGEEVWVNVLAWTVQDLDRSIAESTIRSLAQEPFRREVWEALFHPDLLEIQSLLQDLMMRLALELTERLDGVFSPAQLRLGTITLEADHVGGYRRRTQQAEVRLSHVLTRTEDFKLLPWELLSQLQQLGGFPMVQLVMLLTAHGMRQSHPMAGAFSLRASEVLEQLDWPMGSVSMLLFEMERLGAMGVSSVWMLDSQGTQAQAFQVSGRMWEVLTDVRGEVDWKTGQIERPDLVLFTVRPGLWISQVMEYGATDARRSFEGFARLALALLTLDLCREPMLLGLLIYLMRSTLMAQASELACFSVQELLEAVLLTPATQVFTDPIQALELWDDWNQALVSLRGLGWTPDLAQDNEGLGQMGTQFYVQPCPSWLSPLSGEQKPLDWVEQWLAQSVLLRAPQESKEGLGRSPRTPQINRWGDRSARKLRFDRLTGSEIRTARKALRLTQAQLAQALHVHQSLVAKIEAGRRSITEDLELSLRQVLHL